MWNDEEFFEKFDIYRFVEAGKKEGTPITDWVKIYSKVSCRYDPKVTNASKMILADNMNARLCQGVLFYNVGPILQMADNVVVFNKYGTQMGKYFIEAAAPIPGFCDYDHCEALLSTYIGK